MVNSDFNVEYLIEDLYKLFAFKKEMYLEIDLESYIDYASINNLIGSTKGYVGYEQGGILSEHILKYPLSLVYFKNIKTNELEERKVSNLNAIQNIYNIFEFYGEDEFEQNPSSGFKI